MTLKDVILQARTRGDIATILLSGTLGFVTDAGLDILNFADPLEAGGVFSAVTISLKMAWEELTEKSRNKNEANKKAKTVISLIENSDNPDKSKIIEKINTDKRLYELEVITLEEFDKTLIDVINNVLRKQIKPDKQIDL